MSEQVWLVASGEYSDYSVQAVCATYELACGIAVRDGCYVDGPVDFHGPDEVIPLYKLTWTCIVQPGADSTKPLTVRLDSTEHAVDAQTAAPRVFTRPNGQYRWARAENYLSAEEAEAAARTAYEEATQ